MLRKTITMIVILLLVAGILTLTFNVKLLKASGTIYIRADGSVEGTDKIERDGNIYTFIDNIYDEIVVERDNIVIDGAGHVLEGTATGTGINLTTIENTTIKNMTIKTFDYGIVLEKSSVCNICGNNITMNFLDGLSLRESANNNIIGNNITLNRYDGIVLSSSNSTIVFGNNITASGSGIKLNKALNNTLSKNIIEATTYYGIAFYSSNCNIVSRNSITATTGGKAGILIGGSNNNISENTVMANYWNGIVVSGSSNNVSENTVTGNGWIGIELYSMAFNNTISGNKVTGNEGDGIYINESFNNSISANTVTGNNGAGILIRVSFNNSISENYNVVGNRYGICLEESFSNRVSGNTVASNDYYGLYVSNSYNNEICGNIISGNQIGIELSGEASNNTVYHNNFLNNEARQAYSVSSTPNVWDAGYPLGGNYWSDYEIIDQNCDGIGDAAYIIHGYFINETDRYPFIVPIGSIPVFDKETRYDCIIDGSMTVSRFSMDENKTISFNINGHGCMNLTIPRTLVDGSFKTFINNDQISYKALWNKDYNFIYFEYATSVPIGVRVEAQMKLQGDLNSDGIVNIRDIFIVAKNFGKTLEG